MDYTELKMQVREKMLSELEVCYPVYGQPLIITRCPYCGDSRKSLRKGHFRVKIDVSNEEEPILYHCARCAEGGILTPAIMRILELNDLEINSSLIENNNRIIKASRKKFGIKDNHFQWKIPKPDLSHTGTRNKMDYLNDRLGIDLGPEEWVRLKTIFSLGHFFQLNDIKHYTQKQDRLNLLHRNYVGFLSIRNEFINFRNIHKDKNLRWDKYSVLPSIENTRKFYTIPNDIDLLSMEPITIHIAEGVLDILGVYYHLNHQNNYRHVYTAVCGSAYLNVLIYFIEMGLIGNVNVRIYSDNNFSPAFYKPIVRRLKPWVNSFHVIYNTIKDKNGKADFGVPKNLISPEELKI
ncbi:hypothetical protein D1872_37890 [compost metagenome]